MRFCFSQCAFVLFAIILFCPPVFASSFEWPTWATLCEILSEEVGENERPACERVCEGQCARRHVFVREICMSRCRAICNDALDDLYLDCLEALGEQEEL